MRIGYVRGMGALEVLRADHENVLAMLDRLAAAPTVADGADHGVLQARKQLVIDIVVAESRHEAIEEELFWPLVRKEVPGGDELADHGVDQERAAKYLLKTLEETPADHDDIDAMIERLVTDGRAHIEYEEREVWPRVREEIAPDRLDAVGEKMAGAAKSAPTRPHPDTPPAPAVQRTAGRAAAAVDHIRDSLSRRGKHG